ncbi:MAG: glycoside hydrolase domain-containing protein, partial [Actinomycetota bacterium]
LDGLATRWRNAFDPDTGLLVDSTFYEGGRWNYSFRLLHDMAARIELTGGEDRFMELLDRFFGHGAPSVKQLGQAPSSEEVAAGYALNRFEGLNNEPDIEAPWAYHYVGRPDRTAEIVHHILQNQFGTGRGGLPGNDDSGGLSSWYVWASLGLFPVAGQNLFLVNAPAFRGGRIARGGGAELTITTEGFTARHPDAGPQYVVAARLDHQPLDRTWITGSELRAASVLHLHLADQPDRWADGSRPPSLDRPNRKD